MKQTRSQIRRLYWIDVTLQWGDFPSAPLLAKELGVSRGTIHRDLQIMRSTYNTPLSFDPPQGGYTYARPFCPELPDLPAEDIIEIASVLTRSGNISGSALSNSLQRLSEKISALLPSDAAAANTLTQSRACQTRHNRAPEKKTTSESDEKTDKEAAEIVEVELRFDHVIATDVLAAQIFDSDKIQLLTNGGFEVSINTDNPDLLLLDLLGWAPDFAIINPPWLRRRLPQLLKRLLKHYQ